MAEIRNIRHLKLINDHTFLSLGWNLRGQFIYIVSLCKNDNCLNFFNSKGILYKKMNIIENETISCLAWNLYENVIAIGLGNGKLIISSLQKYTSSQSNSSINALLWLNQYSLITGDKSGKVVHYKYKDTELTSTFNLEFNKEIINFAAFNWSRDYSGFQPNLSILIVITKNNIFIVKDGMIDSSINVKDNIKRAFINEKQEDIYIITQTLNVFKYSISPLMVAYETKLSGHSNSLSISFIEKHILVFATGDNILKFLDMKLNSFDTLGITKNLWENEDNFLALDFNNSQTLLAAGTYMGAIFLWHTDQTDSLKVIKWHLVYHAHNHSLIKELKWQPDHDKAKLLILSPRKICMLQNILMPVYCTVEITIAPSSAHALLIESVIGDYETFSKPLTLKQSSEMRGYTYGCGFIITWDEEKFYAYSLNRNPLSIRTIGTFQFPTKESYQCQSCEVWDGRAFAYFHITNNDPNLASPDTDILEFKTSVLYTFSLKQPPLPLQPFISLNNDKGEGQIENCEIYNGVLSICTTSNCLKAYRMVGKVQNLFPQSDQPHADVFKDFASFKCESWSLVQARNNKSATIFSLRFRKKFLRDLEVIILWDEANDILFPVEIDPLQKYSPFACVKEQYWDEEYPFLFAVILGSQKKADEEFSFTLLLDPTSMHHDLFVSTEDAIRVFECIPLLINQTLVKMQFPHLIYGLQLEECCQGNDNIPMSMGTSKNVIVDTFPIFDIPVPSRSNSATNNVITSNFSKSKVTLSRSEIQQLLNILSDYTFNRWPNFLQCLKDITEPKLFAYLIHFFLERRDLKMVKACAKPYFGQTKFTFFAYLLDNHVPSILSSIGDRGKGISDDIKIAACYAYFGLREKSMELLRGISATGDYTTQEACLKLVLGWSNQPRKLDSKELPSYTLNRLHQEIIRFEFQDILYNHVSDPRTNFEQRIQELICDIIKNCSPHTALRDIASILVPIANRKSSADDGIERICNMVTSVVKITEISQKPSALSLFQWLAQYLEANGFYEAALKFYERANDDLSIVKMYCKLGQLREATKYAEEHYNSATYFYLGQKYEKQGDYLDSIKYFMLAKAYSIALNLCKANNLEDELFELAAKFPASHRAEIAKYYERAVGYEDKAEILYKNMGNHEKALKMALKTSNMESLYYMVDQLETDIEPLLLAKIIERFMANNQIERAIKLYMKVGKYREAIKLCIERYPNTIETVASDIFEKANSSKDKMKQIVSLNVGDGCIEKLAECATKVGNHQIACKIYATLLGDKIQAMKSLIRSGNRSKILQFAQISRNADIYILAANYLQTTVGWRTDPNLYKHIVENYTKAKAYQQLIIFYESCAQNAIEDAENYADALTFLHQASKIVPKLVESSTQYTNSKMVENRLKFEMDRIRNHLKAQKSLKENDESVITICQQLLDQAKNMKSLNLNVNVNQYHIMSLMIQYLTKNGRMAEAEKIVVDTQSKSPSIDLEKVLGEYILNKIRDS